MSTDPTLDEQVEALFPLDGPYGDERTRAAARSIAALVRYLNHATWNASATPYPSTIDSVVGSLSATTSGLDQLLRQLTNQLGQHVARPEAYATGGGTARDVGDRAADALDSAALCVARVQSYLGAARNLTSRIGLNEPDEEVDQ